jgi:GT2 family glycosyltransferase
MKTSVVILNWNGLEYLRMFLGKLVSCSAGPDTEVCLADNGSTDGSADWAAEHYKDIHIIRLGRNFGFAEGYNRAVEKIDSEYYVFINSDVEVTPDWLKPLTDFMDKNPGAAACQPKILDYNKKDHFEYAGAAGGYIDRLGYPFCRGRIFDFKEKDKGQYDNQAEIFWSSGACMIIRSDAWKKSGGFDNDFFAHMEEIDLCWRLSMMGFSIGFVPDSRVYHIGGGSLAYESPFKVYLNFRNSLWMLYKNLPDGKLFTRLFIRMLFDGVAALGFLVKGRLRSFFAIVKAHKGFYGNIKKLKEKRRIIKSMSSDSGLPRLVVNKCIVFEFYFKGRKTFGSLSK